MEHRGTSPAHCRYLLTGTCFGKDLLTRKCLLMLKLCRKILTSDAMLLTTRLAGYFHLESTETMKNGNAFFLDRDKEMRIKRQGRYTQLSVLRCTLRPWICTAPNQISKSHWFLGNRSRYLQVVPDLVLTMPLLHLETHLHHKLCPQER